MPAVDSSLLTSLGVLKVIALVFFVGMWLFIAIRLLVRRSSDYELTAQLPLNDDRVLEPRQGENRDV